MRDITIKYYARIPTEYCYHIFRKIIVLVLNRLSVKTSWQTMPIVIIISYYITIYRYCYVINYIVLTSNIIDNFRKIKGVKIYASYVKFTLFMY